MHLNVRVAHLNRRNFFYAAIARRRQAGMAVDYQATGTDRDGILDDHDRGCESDTTTRVWNLSFTHRSPSKFYMLCHTKRRLGPYVPYAARLLGVPGFNACSTATPRAWATVSNDWPVSASTGAPLPRFATRLRVRSQ
jgi:hypothetical protein